MWKGNFKQLHIHPPRSRYIITQPPDVRVLHCWNTRSNNIEWHTVETQKITTQSWKVVTESLEDMTAAASKQNKQVFATCEKEAVRRCIHFSKSEIARHTQQEFCSTILEGSWLPAAVVWFNSVLAWNNHNKTAWLRTASLQTCSRANHGNWIQQQDGICKLKLK